MSARKTKTPGQSMPPPDDIARAQTVCFTGHRVLHGSLAEAAQLLFPLLEKLYQQGYRTFISGAALGFDQQAAWEVVRLREHHGDVRLILALPCLDQTEPWTASQARDYEQLLYAADKLEVLSGAYTAGCMHMRNRFMVDHAALCVALFQEGARGGTRYTVQYARKQGIQVLNLCDEADVEACLSRP